MLFSSLIFMLFFLPVGYLIYCLTKDKYKNLVLLLLSLIFYSWGEIKYLWVLGLSFFVNYICARWIAALDAKAEIVAGEIGRDGRGSIAEKIVSAQSQKVRRKASYVLALDIVVSIGLLGIFKYANFFIDLLNQGFSLGISRMDLALPLGISFFTFQILSYTIDVYRGKVKVNKSVLEVALYVALFPQLIAGPIVRYKDIENELNNRKQDWEQVEQGVKLFICGLASKVLMANSFGAIWEDMANIGYDNLSAPMAWFGLIAFSMQIYFDFYGYSLMAIGLGKMFGFEFPQNFNYPYVSRSITEFWRRWHMTLGSWFREYVYIPLGGNRKGKLRTFINLFIVWALTGFWHGASLNFVCWGLYFFVFLMLEKAFLLKWLEKSKVLSHVYALFLIVFGWGIFAITDFAELGNYISHLFGAGGVDVSQCIYYASNHIPLLILGVLLQIPALCHGVYEKLQHKKAFGCICMAALLLICLANLTASAYNPFLYFRF